MGAFPPDLLQTATRARNVVVFTGAGVSAESGIPTFRDALSGLWERFDAERLATAEAFRADKALVWGWYEWRRMKALRAQPNPAHVAIARWAEKTPALTVVTQNVDDLHERAGSPRVLHLHGSLHAPRCFVCGKDYAQRGMPDEPEGGRHLKPPVCPDCGGDIRPGVVWFGESLPEKPLREAFAAVEQCDLLVAIGTSGVVQPAAGLPGLARSNGAAVLQINPTATPLDAVANWSLRGAAGELMPALLTELTG